MFTTNFGIEVETSGITREQAANVAAEFLGGTISRVHDHYDTWKVTAPDGRVWKFMYDGSIKCQKKVRGTRVPADSTYSVEMVSPILSYREDIETLQELIRRLRKAGCLVDESMGVHVHLDGSKHTPRSIRNFINIIASKNELLYKALQIEPARMRFCKKMDSYLVERMNQNKPQTFEEIADIWYEGYSQNRALHYHESRYFFANFHSFFQKNHTVELRAFNSDSGNGTLHAGVIRAYIILALAINHQALTQKCASSRKPQTDNEKFAMRTYLNRIGLIGEEFKNCREHLCKHLEGSAAWRFKTQG